jgi:hypothetical protein
VLWIQCGGGRLLRPIQRLYSLEVSGAVEIPISSEAVAAAREDYVDQEEHKIVVTRTGLVLSVPRMFQGSILLLKILLKDKRMVGV